MNFKNKFLCCKKEVKTKDEIIEAYKVTNDFLTKTSTIIFSFAAIICAVTTILAGIEIYRFEDTLHKIENDENATRYIIMAEKTNSTEEKINYYSLAINYDKENDFLYCERAKLYYDMGTNNLALKDCSKAISINNTNLDAYYIRGKTYYGNNQYEYAIKDFLECAAINPDEVNFYIGYSYYYLTQYENAALYFDNCRFLAPPDEIDGWHERECITDCYFKNKNYKKAIQSLSLLLDICRTKKHIETITERLKTIYTEQKDYESVVTLTNMLNDMQDQYEKINAVSPNTLNIRGIETYQMLFHELDIRINSS